MKTIEEQQKEKINRMLRTSTENEIKWLRRIEENPNSSTYDNMVQRMAEYSGRKNGIIETALALGYHVKYDRDIPQIV